MNAWLWLLVCVGLPPAIYYIPKHRNPKTPHLSKLEALTQRVGWLVEVNDYFFTEIYQCDTEEELIQMHDFYAQSFDGLWDYNIRPDKLLKIARVISGKNDGSFPFISPPLKPAMQNVWDKEVAFQTLARIPYDAFNPQSDGWTTQRAVKDGFVVYREVPTPQQIVTPRGMVVLNDTFCAYLDCPQPKMHHVHDYASAAIIEPS